MATNAKKDGNSVSAMICASSADGSTIVPLYTNSTNNGLKISDGTTGSNFGTSIAKKDENGVAVFMAVSSADGVTPIEVYADPVMNSLLIKST